MTDIESLLTRWQAAGVVDAETAARIRAYEETAGGVRGTAQLTEGELVSNPRSPKARDRGHPGSSIGLHWQGITALVLGAILLACGVVLFVSAHWDELGTGERFALVCALVAVFHMAGGMARTNYRALSTALHAVGTVAAGAAIALVGQIFNIEEHWPGAVLLWALAALAGWLLLRDQAQQTIALLLVPAWIYCEFLDKMSGHIGCPIFLGRLLFVWAILYLTFFAHSQRVWVRGILFAASAIVAVSGVAMMLDGWSSYRMDQGFVPFDARFWAWIGIAAVPLAVAAFHGHKGLIPIAAAIAFVLALPWCYQTWPKSGVTAGGITPTYQVTSPNLLAYALVAGFAVFVCWWGVGLASRALVNLGIVGFAVAVVWFYFSDLMTKLGRSLGLIGLGVLFLAGGWALEKMRRRILAGLGTRD
jgi:uncharacterized membrane protein